MILTADQSYALPLERVCFGVKPRTPGLHLSNIIYDLDQRWPGKAQSQEAEPDTPIDPTLAHRGFIFERIMARAFGEELESGELLDQIELTSPEGVLLTLDGWVWRYPGLVREYKSTRRSSKKLDSAENFQRYFRKWDWQVQGYCKTAGVLHCELYVLWLGSDWYSNYPGGQEPVRKYDLWYEAWEINETWRMLMAHGETMRREGRTGL